MKKSLFAIWAITVILIGCDAPHTGPLLSVRDVDQYLSEMGTDTVCIQDGFDSVCVRVIVKEVEKQRDTTPAPIIHIHPAGVLYELYHEDLRILRAERLMDTTEITEALVAAGVAELPAENLLLVDDERGTPERTFEGWRIQMYYPESFAEIDRGDTLETSGFDIRIVKGRRVLLNTEKDLDIINFTQIDEVDGARIAQFDVETDASQIMIRVRGLVPGHIARFRLNTDGITSDQSDDTFELQKIQ